MDGRVGGFGLDGKMKIHSAFQKNESERAHQEHVETKGERRRERGIRGGNRMLEEGFKAITERKVCGCDAVPSFAQSCGLMFGASVVVVCLWLE